MVTLKIEVEEKVVNGRLILEKAKLDAEKRLITLHGETFTSDYMKFSIE